MNEVAMVLDDLVADAPLDGASWNDVLARSRKVRPRHSRQRLVLALAAAVLLAVAGTAVGLSVNLLAQQEHFHANLADDPQRLGPLVEVASGEDWALIAWRSEVGICLDFAVPGNSPFSCGFPVRGQRQAQQDSGAGQPIHAVAGFVSGGGLVGGDGETTIFGVAARNVATVKVELRDGTIVNTAIFDAPPKLDENLRFFVARVSLSPEPTSDGTLPLPSHDPVRAYNAYDRDGGLIERVEDPT